MRLLAVAATERLSGVDVPRLRELGYAVVFADWRGISVHKSLGDESANRGRPVCQARQVCALEEDP
jgi:putative tricarboxylic transport membrane protein